MNTQTITEQIRNLPEPFPGISFEDVAFNPGKYDRKLEQNHGHKEARMTAAALTAPLEASHSNASKLLDDQIADVKKEINRIDKEKDEWMQGRVTGLKDMCDYLQEVKDTLANAEKLNTKQ